MKNMNKLFNHAMDIVTMECNIEIGNITKIELNYRAKGRFGQCHKKKNGTYELNFNYLIFDDKANDDAIITCMIHEILHTCKGGMTHKGEWKRLANVVREKTGYNVTRCNSYSDFGIEEPNRRNYVFRCEKCGQEIVRERMSDFVKRYDKYRCGECHGKFQFIPEESNCKILTSKPKNNMHYVNELANRFLHE